MNRALINFAETARFFPPARTERTGVPVRGEFFNLRPRSAGSTLTVLITGGSQGSRTLNNAAKAAWPLFLEAKIPVRLLHQTGTAMQAEMAEAFAKTGLAGSVDAFITDMPGAFDAADIVVARSGAGTTSELAAAGKPSILIPFPFAADDHQAANARAMEHAGAAITATDGAWTGERFFSAVRDLYGDRARLAAMGTAARTMAFPNAAKRAAEILIESVDKTPASRNNK